MPEIPRLNGVIQALEKGQTACVGFALVDMKTASTGLVCRTRTGAQTGGAG